MRRDCAHTAAARTKTTAMVVKVRENSTRLVPVAPILLSSSPDVRISIGQSVEYFPVAPARFPLSPVCQPGGGSALCGSLTRDPRTLDVARKRGTGHLEAEFVPD